MLLGDVGVPHPHCSVDGCVQRGTRRAVACLHGHPVHEGGHEHREAFHICPTRDIPVADAALDALDNQSVRLDAQPVKVLARLSAFGVLCSAVECPQNEHAPVRLSGLRDRRHVVAHHLLDRIARREFGRLERAAPRLPRRRHVGRHGFLEELLLGAERRVQARRRDSAHRLLKVGERRAVVPALTKHADRCLVTTGRDPERLAAAKAALPDEVVVMRADAREMSDSQAVADEVRSRFGRLDALFLNAGVGPMQPVEAVSEAAFDDNFAVTRARRRRLGVRQTRAALLR